MVRSAAIGQDGRHNGFLALKLLSNRFNPKTPAKLFRALMEILVPGMVKEVRDVPRAVEEWEVKCARVAEEYGEKLSEGMRVAVLIMMLPKDMQEMVYQMGKVGEDLMYQEVRDKVVAVAGHKAKIRIPMPREESAGVQEVQSWSWGGTECQICEQDGDWWGGEVDALGKGLAGTKCHNAEEYGISHVNAGLQ